MNPQLTTAMAHSHQQDLRRAAEMSRSAAGLSTRSALRTRLRATISPMWAKRSAPSPASPAARSSVIA
jgi:hypothetical protein